MARTMRSASSGVLVPQLALHRLVAPALALVFVAANCFADPTDKPVDAAALVREVRASRAWVDHLSSAQLHFHATWVRTAQGQQRRIAALKRQFPNETVDEKTFPELRRERRQLGELAFDAHRLYSRTEWPEQPDLLIRTWDGQRATLYHKSGNEETYLFDAEPYRNVGRDLFVDLPFFSQRPAAFWWARAHSTSGEDFFGNPDDFQLAGQKQFHNENCYVLHDKSTWMTLYIGVADHRLYGSMQRVLRPGTQAQADQVLAGLAMELGAHAALGPEWNKWFMSLHAATRKQVMREQHLRLWNVSEPQFTFWYANYQQPLPGCPMPMVQGTDNWNDDGTGLIIVDTVERRIDSARFNQPPRDELFHVDLREGVRVFDRSHDPLLLVYKYQKHFTADEWRKIVDEGSKRLQEADARNAAMASVVGRPAADLPTGTWLNSKALRWSDLKGQIVVLDFWAEWCGPCRNDFPLASKLYQERTKTGITIIGVHPAETDISKVKKVMKEFQIEYPICIDAPPPTPDAPLGLLFSQLGVGMLPQAFVIDRRGVVAGYGTLEQVIATARALAVNDNAEAP